MVLAAYKNHKAKKNLAAIYGMQLKIIFVY